jgi:hypothetical protein
MGAGRYIRNRSLAFDGHAFHPSIPSSVTPIYFDLVTRGHQNSVSFEKPKKAQRIIVADASNPAVSCNAMERLAHLSHDKPFVSA